MQEQFKKRSEWPCPAGQAPREGGRAGPHPAGRIGKETPGETITGKAELLEG